MRTTNQHTAVTGQPVASKTVLAVALALLVAVGMLTAGTTQANAASTLKNAGTGKYEASIGQIKASLDDQQITTNDKSIFSYASDKLIYKNQSTGLINFGSDDIHSKLTLVRTKVTVGAAYKLSESKPKKVVVGCRHWISNGIGKKWLGKWTEFTLSGTGSSVGHVLDFSSGGVQGVVTGWHDIGLSCWKDTQSGWATPVILVPLTVKSNYVFLPINAPIS